jgi:hypothetical protein
MGFYRRVTAVMVVVMVVVMMHTIIQTSSSKLLQFVEHINAMVLPAKPQTDCLWFL